LSFVHEDDAWPDLLAIVAEATGRQTAFVEKDYWVTHTMWALHAQGFDVWFKGGTSLSKGFGLIQRFSEDLDLRIDAGSVPNLTTPVLPWDDNNKKRREKGIAERDAWFDAMTAAMRIPGCTVTRNPIGSDDKMRSAWLEVVYPVLHAATLPLGMRPFVLLEVGRARVVPSIERPLSSWVHEHLAQRGQLAEFDDNRPDGVRCVHPMVTCLEKLEAIARKFDKGKAPADFVRHYEDAAQIVLGRDDLPLLEAGLDALAKTLRAEDGKAMPASSHAAFNPDDGDRWRDLRSAWEAIGPMYWGPRLSPEDATAIVRSFLDELAV
jgi:hypothetical protein